MANTQSTRHQELTEEMKSKLQKFSDLYTQLQGQGFYPTGIRDEIMQRTGISRTTFYTYLRASRENGYVTDSYEENHAKFLERQRVKRAAEQQKAEDENPELNSGRFVYEELIKPKMMLDSSHTESATADSVAYGASVVNSEPTLVSVVLDAPKIQKKGFLSKIKSFLGIK